jgi:hypothetical protein
MYQWLFWIGFLLLVGTNSVMLIGGTMRLPAVVALLGTALMFVGSKLGREFLGIRDT